VFDFEPVSAQDRAPAHFGYMASASTTSDLRANRELPEVPAAPAPPQRRLQGRPELRALRSRWNTPIVIAPTGATSSSIRRRARRRARGESRQPPADSFDFGSTSSTTRPRRAARRSVQLYASPAGMSPRADQACRGRRCPVLVVTVDRHGGPQPETLSGCAARHRNCQDCHQPESWRGRGADPTTTHRSLAHDQHESRT